MSSVNLQDCSVAQQPERQLSCCATGEWVPTHADKGWAGEWDWIERRRSRNWCLYHRLSLSCYIHLEFYDSNFLQYWTIPSFANILDLSTHIFVQCNHPVSSHSIVNYDGHLVNEDRALWQGGGLRSRETQCGQSARGSILQNFLRTSFLYVSWSRRAEIFIFSFWEMTASTVRRYFLIPSHVTQK